MFKHEGKWYLYQCSALLRAKLLCRCREIFRVSPCCRPVGHWVILTCFNSTDIRQPMRYLNPVPCRCLHALASALGDLAEQISDQLEFFKSSVICV